jgi:hypothetical protein
MSPRFSRGQLLHMDHPESAGQACLKTDARLDSLSSTNIDYIGREQALYSPCPRVAIISSCSRRTVGNILEIFSYGQKGFHKFGISVDYLVLRIHFNLFLDLESSMRKSEVLAVNLAIISWAPKPRLLVPELAPKTIIL